jgi:osmotically-inducible protein OsmY
MKIAFSCKVLAPSVVLSLGLALPAMAQSDNAATAGESMSAAGQSIEQAGSDTSAAAREAYRGTVTAVRDTEITAQVKAALHDDRTTEHADIHVSTSAGVVTLHGRVASTDIAMRASELAQNAKGVKEVRNELEVSGPTIAD